MLYVIQVWPLSGVFHSTRSNVICDTGLTIIRSFSLYTQQCYMWYRFDHHQEFFTVHTAMLYVIQVWPPSGVFHCTHSDGICHRGLTIIRSFALYTQQCYMWYRFDHHQEFSLYTQQCYMSYRFDQHQEFFTVHIAMLYVIQVSPSSGVFTVHTAMVYVIQVWPVWHIPLLYVQC